MTTKEQVIELAQSHRQMWRNCTSRPFTTREAEFATLVRNAVLEDAATEFAGAKTQSGEDIAAAIRNMKDNT